MQIKHLVAYTIVIHGAIRMYVIQYKLCAEHYNKHNINLLWYDDVS